jgi:hypothetical protein
MSKPTVTSPSAPKAETIGPQDYTLTRSGNVPLSFTGELLAEQAGKWHRGKERSRYFELRLYKTKGGKYIVERVFKTYYKGEAGYNEAFACSTLQDAADVLRKWDPAELPGVGLPPGKQFEAKQNFLMSNLRHMYQDRMTTLLADFDIVEHVD